MIDTRFFIKQELDSVRLTVVINTDKTKVKQNIKCNTVQEAEELIMDISKINNKLNKL